MPSAISRLYPFIKIVKLTKLNIFGSDKTRKELDGNQSQLGSLSDLYQKNLPVYRISAYII